MSSFLYQLFNEILIHSLSAVQLLERIIDHPNDKVVCLHGLLRLKMLRTDIEKSASLISKHYAEKSRLVELFQLYNMQLSLNNCMSNIDEASEEDEAREDLELLKSEIELLKVFINSK